MDRLAKLEAQSIYILREAFSQCDKIAMRWSIGKDSNVMLRLAQKAFFGHVPFPVLHIDTSFKLPEMIEFRDKMAKKLNLDLIVRQNTDALASGMDHTKGRITCCNALKTSPLKAVIQEFGFSAVFAGIRGDEEGTRAKERVFSPRGDNSEWLVKNQPAELWEQYNTEFPPGTHLRVHPLLYWTEIDVWQYIKRESLEIVDLYFAKNGKRYRSLGCAPCTDPINSQATTIDEIIAELQNTKVAERAGRAQDKASEDAFEQLRTQGYM